MGLVPSPPTVFSLLIMTMIVGLVHFFPVHQQTVFANNSPATCIICFFGGLLAIAKKSMLLYRCCFCPILRCQKMQMIFAKHKVV